MPDSRSGKRPEFSLPPHIQRGDIAPWWKQGPHKFVFDLSAGRYIVLGFLGGVAGEPARDILRALQNLGRTAPEDQTHVYAILRGLSEPEKAALQREFPVVRFIWDDADTMHRAYGVVGYCAWIVLNPMLRVIEAIPFRADGASTQRLTELMATLPSPSTFAGIELPAPVLIVPDCFEESFCRYLIEQHRLGDARESGFMQEVAGQAVEHHDPAWKRRTDHHIADPELIGHIKVRMARRLGHMLNQTFHFTFTRMERFLIACYADQEGGHFGPHRDDTIPATEHRRFAVSINLNANFEGGELSFPEFSSRSFKAPPGAAVIFSASMLHRVGEVTQGKRYAFLPFLHDEEAEKKRLENLRFLNASSGPP
jgi:predicted 2-oxoglutarate/Fe(II)-dependent dioxygenase YbiX